ncbi:MAG: AAA family ATPase, partial [Candidatus Cloacimonetes bacterium]|nr:AAA family ATPase [Candidatus Cloacimonadota bacterium]
ITKNAEINAIQKALNACNFDKSKTAELLGIPRSTLYRLREKYNLA